jgi:hypothetical protein
MKRSHTTQVLQNYFDPTDRRSRESSTSLEAQLLNLAANPLEDLDLRITRENAQSLQTVPVNIDNGGVYYSGRVPQAFLTGPDQTTFTSVVGQSGATQRTLVPYDDRLPTPSRVEVGTPVALSNPVMFTLVGSGDDRLLEFTVQYAAPGKFPIPNKLSLWVDQIGLDSVSVTLTIVGEVAPQPAWFAERRKTTEVLTLNGEGYFSTRNRWAVIDKIAVRGLPLGVRLRGLSMPFNLPATPDQQRPLTTPEDRDLTFARYWQISSDENLLKEMYRAGGFTGLEAYRTYLMNDSLIDLAVEPNTYGMYAISSSTLYYFDRREDLPTMVGTGLSAEPLFGLQVLPDPMRTGPVRFVVLSGVPYASANEIFQYRYTVNGVNSILPDGSLGAMDRGWRGGAPQPVSFPLQNIGDYTFQLELQDGNGTTTIDVVTYNNAAATPLKSLDLTNLIDVPTGIAFDSYGTLWVWNGSYAIPIVIHYDAYVFDADTQTIFLTDPYDNVQVS